MGKANRTSPARSTQKKTNLKLKANAAAAVVPSLPAAVPVKGESSDTLNRLREQYRTDGLNLFLGAGVSLTVGLPSWWEMLIELTLEVIAGQRSVEDPSRSDAASFRHLFEENEDKRRQIGEALEQ